MQLSKEKPRLVICCTHSFGAKFLKGQLGFMKNNGFEVFVISGRGKEIELICEEERANFIPFDFKREISPFNDFINVFKLVKILKKIKPDIINTGTPKAGLLISIAGKFLRNVPVIFTLRGLRSETLLGTKKFVVQKMEQLTCSFAQIVIPISPSLYEHATKLKILDPRKAVVLGKGSSNGINVQYFTKTLSSNSKESLRIKIGVNKDDFLIAYVGRLNNDKGIPELYNSFKELSKGNSKLKLLLVGKFEEEDSVSQELQLRLRRDPHVILQDYTDNVKDVYEIIDLLVLLSKREGFGNILIEASSMGVPVIASNIPGCRDAVNHGVTGYLVNKSEEVEDHIQTLFNNPSLSEKLGNNGVIWVRENFDSNIIWHLQLELYLKLLKNG